MTNLQMPPERDYGWELKQTSSTYFEIHQRDNGQFACILNHSLLRGVTSEMIAWWFQRFQNMKVTLEDVEGFEGKTVPVYLLWHPSDHINATLKGKIGAEFIATAGDTIHIQEAMQYKKYGLKYPVDKELEVFYCQPDGWAMGKKLPLLGEVVVLRVHFKDAIEGDEVIGVHYHYEVVIGLSGKDPVSRFINRKLTADIGPEFFEAWHLHNAIEVGTFENFLPALYAQKSNTGSLRYSKSMNPALTTKAKQTGHNEELFKSRVEGYRACENPYDYQEYNKPSFL